MGLAILSGLIVSIDALFIGISFGAQKRCKLWHLLLINIILFGLCMLGYFLGIWIGDAIDFELDIVIGLLFIALGAWVIVSYFLFEHKKKGDNDKHQIKSITLTGAFMSIEAMFITIGLTLVLDVTTLWIPITVAVAHLVYSVVTFFFAKYLRKLKPIVGYMISGIALVIYGILALIL